MRTFKMFISFRLSNGLLNTEVIITATVVVVRDFTRRHKTGAEDS